MGNVGVMAIPKPGAGGNDHLKPEGEQAARTHSQKALLQRDAARLTEIQGRGNRSSTLILFPCLSAAKSSQKAQSKGPADQPTGLRRLGKSRWGGWRVALDGHSLLSKVTVTGQVTP